MLFVYNSTGCIGYFTNSKREIVALLAHLASNVFFVSVTECIFSHYIFLVVLVLTALGTDHYLLQPFVISNLTDCVQNKNANTCTMEAIIDDYIGLII